MADNNLILDFVAGIRLGTAGIVNQKEVVSSITRDVEKTLKAVTVDAGKITVNPDIKLNKTSLNKAKTALETSLEGISRAIGAKKRGQKIGTDLFDEMFRTAGGRNQKGADKARKALAEIFQPLSIAQLSGLQDAQLAQTRMVDALGQYNALGKKTQQLYNGFQKGGVIPDKDLGRMKQATEAVSKVLDAQEGLRKAAVGGRKVTTPVFGKIGEDAEGASVRGKVGETVAVTPALETRGAAVTKGGREQLKSVQAALAKEDESLRAASERIRSAKKVAEQITTDGFGGLSDRQLKTRKTFLDREQQRLELLKSGSKRLQGYETERLALIEKAGAALEAEQARRKKIAGDIQRANKGAEADRRRTAAEAEKIRSAERTRIREAVGRKAAIAAADRRSQVVPGQPGGFGSLGEVRDAQALLNLEQKRLASNSKLSASRSRRLKQIDEINIRLKAQAQALKRAATEQARLNAGSSGGGLFGGGRGGGGAGRDLDDMSRRAGNLRDRLGETGLLLRQFFRYALGYGALYKALAAVTALTKGVVQLDKELKSIQAISQATEEQMLSIEGAVKSVATTTKFSVQEIAKAARVLAQAGVDPEQINNVLSSVAQFAAGTETALDVAADVASTMRNVFKELEDIQIADKLTKAINISKLTGNDLKVILSISAQIGKSFELSADQYLAAVTTLRNAGLKASTVATGLRQGLLEIFSPDAKSLKSLKDRYAQIGEALSDADIKKRFQSFQAASNPLLAALRELNRLGFTGTGKKTFARAFDIRAENAISALINNIDKLEEAEARISLGGAAAEASSVQMESLSNTLDNLGAAMTVLASDITEGPISALQDLAAETTNVINALDKMDLDLKSLSGEGIGGLFGTAAAGGLAGATLVGGGGLRRLVGATAGAAAGAYGGYSQLESAQQGEITPQQANDTLDTISKLLTVVSLLSLTKGVGAGKFSLKAVSGDLSKQGGVRGVLSATGKAIKEFSTGLGGFLGGITKGFKSLGGLVSGFLRANPIGLALTALYALYETYQAFSDDTEDKADQFEKQQTQLKALKQRTVRERQEADKRRQGFRQFQLTDRAAGVEAAPDTSADLLETAEIKLDRSRSQLQEQFFQEVQNIDALASAFENLASGPASESGSPARRAALEQLSKDTGAALKDISADQDRLLAALISDYLGSIKSIKSLGKALTERYSRLQGRTLKEGSEQAVFVQEFEALQAANPRLYAALQGDVKALAELGGITAVLDAVKRMYTSISSISEAYYTEDLKAGTDNLINEFNKEVEGILEGLESGELTPTAAKAKVIAEIDKLSKTGETSFAALQGALSLVESKLAELNDRISVATGTLVAASTPAPDIDPRLTFKQDYGPGFDTPTTEASPAQIQAAGLTVTEAQEQTQTLEKVRDELGTGLDGLNQIADETAEKAEQQLDTLYAMLQADRELLRQNIEFQGFLRGLEAQGREFLEAGLAGDRAQFQQRGTFVDAEDTRRFGREVPVAADFVKAITEQATKVRSREAVVTEQQRELTEFKKFAPDPDIAKKVGALDTEIARLTKIKSPELFSPDSPLHKRANLLTREIDKELVVIGRNIEEARKDSETDQKGYQKLLTLRKKQGGLEAKKAKLLEGVNKAINDARFAYQKQALATQKEVATAEKKRVAQQIKNLVLDGNVDSLRKLQDERVRVNEDLLATEEKLLRHSGKSEELVRLKIAADRQALQEAEKRKRAEEIVSITQDALKNVGTSATSGSVVEDAAREARGFQFTDAEKLASYAAQAEKTREQIALLQSQIGDPTVEQSALLDELEKLNIQLATLEGQFDRLDTDGFEQAFRSFDPKLIATDLQQLESAFQNLGDSIRGNIVSAIDEIGPALFDAAVSGEDALSVLQSVFYDLFRNIGREAAASLVNSLSQELLAQIESEDARSLFGSLFGISGENIPAAAQTASENQPGDPGAFTSALAAGQATNAAVATVNGQVVNVHGGIAGAQQTQTLLGRISDTNETQVGQNQETIQKSEGWFSNLGNTFSQGLQGLGGLFSSLFSGGGGAGGLFKSVLSFVPSLFGAAEGVAAIGTKQGAVSSSGVISGPGTGISDSIAAALFDRGSVTPIAVGAGESILTAQATQMIGADQIRAWNRGIIRGFAQGRVPASAPSKAASAPAAAVAPQVDASTRIVNVVDPDLVHDYMSSSSGEKVILNTIQKNPGAVKQFLRS